MPKNIISNKPVYLHVRLKGIDLDLDYTQMSQYLVEYFTEKFQPKTILTPLYNYDFLKGIPFNRHSSPCQVGRFGEECRKLYFHSKNRSLNPIFSSLDIHNYYQFNTPVKSSFGNTTIFHKLAEEGYYIINVNLDEKDMRNIHLHYLEEKCKVSYRYFKEFAGEISHDGKNYEPLNFSYFVRELNPSTVWNRKKMADDFYTQDILHKIEEKAFSYNYIYSKNMDDFLLPILKNDDQYMINEERVFL